MGASGKCRSRPALLTRMNRALHPFPISGRVKKIVINYSLIKKIIMYWIRYDFLFFFSFVYDDSTRRIRRLTSVIRKTQIFSGLSDQNLRMTEVGCNKGNIRISGCVGNKLGIFFTFALKFPFCCAKERMG